MTVVWLHVVQGQEAAAPGPIPLVSVRSALCLVVLGHVADHVLHWSQCLSPICLQRLPGTIPDLAMYEFYDDATLKK